MKRAAVLLLSALAVSLLLSSCAEYPDSAKTSSTSPATATAPVPASASATASASAAASVPASASDPETTAQASSAIPNTASKPAALRLSELPSPGVAANFTDENGKLLYTICADRGADGNTPTGNRFDADGNLTEWTAYEYDEAGLKLRDVTRSPDGTLLSSVEYAYFSGGAVSSEKRLLADGSVEYESEYYESGQQRKYTNYSDGSYVMEYSEDGVLTREASYTSGGALTHEIIYSADGATVSERFGE